MKIRKTNRNPIFLINTASYFVRMKSKEIIRNLFIFRLEETLKELLEEYLVSVSYDDNSNQKSPSNGNWRQIV
jgi:hypothetical protein